MTATRQLLPHALLLGCLAASGTAQTTALPGEVLSSQKMSSLAGGFAGALANGDAWGSALAELGDLDGDGVTDLLVGAPDADHGGNGRGAAWVVFLDDAGMALGSQAISDTQGNFAGVLDDADRFGSALAVLGDLGGDGSIEVAVGAPGDDDGAANAGAVWVLSLDTTGEVLSAVKISRTSGGFSGGLDAGDGFGNALANLGDLNGDGLPELAVGASGDDDGGSSRGAVWILFLDAGGAVVDQQKISDIVGGFGGLLEDFDQFGNALAGLGSLDGDAVGDLAVCAFGDDDGGPSHGAVWILFLDPDGTVDDFQKISDEAGGFEGAIANADAFGVSAAALGDIDGNGVTDLAVGVLRDDSSRGAVWILYLEADGTVRGELKIAQGLGGFSETLDAFDHFGFGLAFLEDLDGDGALDLVAGAPGDDDGGADRGALYTLFLEGRYRASFTTRVGSGVNPECVVAGNAPVLGMSWTLLTTLGPSQEVVILGQSRPLVPPLVFPFGELLVDPTAGTIFVSESNTTTHNLPVPNVPAIVGTEVYAQGIRLFPLELCTAIDATIGY